VFYVSSVGPNVIVWYKKDKSMRKLLFFSIVALILGTVVFLWFGSNAQEKDNGNAEEYANTVFIPEVEAVLNGKIAMISALVQDRVIVEEIRKSNERNKNLSLQEILKLDKKWRQAKESDDFIQRFLNNAVALRLIEFQKENSGFPEIFVVDAYGLNVGQTNKTTDFYQADEDWWVHSYNKGAGLAFHGPIEFDESAHTVAVALYVPVVDSLTNRVIGVTKTIVDIASIKLEL